MPKYWLLKSEPEAFSWTDLVTSGVSIWDGVRNYQAANNLKAMALGDLAFFYHSGPGAGKIGPHIKGICEILSTAFCDPTDESGKWVVVEVRALEALPRPILLRDIKADPILSDMALLRQPRLSVSPVRPHEWHYICDKAKYRPEH